MVYTSGPKGFPYTYFKAPSFIPYSYMDPLGLFMHDIAYYLVKGSHLTPGPSRSSPLGRYILGAQRGSHILTLRPKYIPYSYMDPLGCGDPRRTSSASRQG